MCKKLQIFIDTPFVGQKLKWYFQVSNRRVYPLINFQEILHPTSCYLSLPVYQFSRKFPASLFFTYTNEKNSTLPAVIRAYLLIKFEEKFQSTLLLEQPLYQRPKSKVFWNENKIRRIWALNTNVRKIDMHSLFLSKYIQVQNYKSINSKPLLGSIFSIEFELLVQTFLFIFLRYYIL